jgi:xanthine dehydrogenase YagR molybdenum-binding subunit
MPEATGKPLDRVDGPLKVSGTALYTADQRVPGVAHAVMVMSSIATGRIISIDTAGAEKVPGVLAVLSHKDGLKLAADPKKTNPANPADRSLQVLQDDRVYYSNQPIAVAVAESFEAACEAADRVRVQYESQAPSIRLDAANSFVPEKAGGGGDPGQSLRGDPDKAFREAEVRLEEIYTTPFHTHSPMEPHATTAVWDGPRKLTLYDTSQGIFGARKRMAELFGLDPEDVRVISLFLGGGFGSKGPTWSHAVICAMAARHVNRPVKLVVRRPQMFGAVGSRSATQQTISIGATKGGRIVSLTNETLSHTSQMDQFVETATMPSRMMYSTPNNRTVQRVVRSDIGTPSYTRAPGEATGTFALEVAMDEMAYKLNLDPVEFRLRNYAEQDEDKKLPWSTKSLRECYQRGAERFGWSRRRNEPSSMRDGNTLIGWGMGTSVYPARRSPASARARMYPDGHVLVEAGTQDLGGGTYTIMTQIAADALEVPVTRVVFRLGDTLLPETPVSGGSQTAASAGSAVYQACVALRDKLKATSASERAAQPWVEAEIKTPENGDAKKFSSYSFGAQFAEVHVDRELGTIHVARMTGVFAAGKILNAKTARSQFIGGMVWGVSMALHEMNAYDPRLGRIVNNNLAEYHVPTNADVGNIDVSWVDEDDEYVSFTGSKGIGEIGITGSSAAIANAIYHATGKRVRSLPITMDHLI